MRFAGAARCQSEDQSAVLPGTDQPRTLGARHGISHPSGGKLTGCRPRRCGREVTIVIQVRRHRQGAAGILPAVLFSDWSAGKMPAALWFMESLHGLLTAHSDRELERA